MNTEAFKASTQLPTTGELVKDPEGHVCPVLDTNSLDKSSAVMGRKKETTRVIKAKGGEKTGQSFTGGKETYDYFAKEGDAIFVNSPTDQYVPSGLAQGERLQFDDLEKKGFRIAGGNKNEVQVYSPPAKLLVGIVDSRICIKNAWGDSPAPSNHQFLSKGATLKVGGNGKITGMDKEGFEKWEVIPAESVPQHKSSKTI